MNNGYRPTHYSKKRLEDWKIRRTATAQNLQISKSSNLRIFKLFITQPAVFTIHHFTIH